MIPINSLALKSVKPKKYDIAIENIDITPILESIGVYSAREKIVKEKNKLFINIDYA